MSSNEMSLGETLRNNLVVWAAMLVGQLFFVAIAVYMVKYGGMNKPQLELGDILLYIVPLISLISVFMSFYIFNQRLNALKDEPGLSKKLADYRSALIVRWALVEGPSFFAIVSYLLTGNYLLLGFAIILIAIFILIMPSSSKLDSDLELSWQDKNDRN